MVYLIFLLKMNKEMALFVFFHQFYIFGAELIDEFVWEPYLVHWLNNIGIEFSVHQHMPALVVMNTGPFPRG